MKVALATERVFEVSDVYCALTKEDWEEFCEAPRSEPPERLTRAAWRRLSTSRRASYDDARQEHVANFGPLWTPQMKRIHGALSRQARANGRRIGARRSTVVDGAAGLGKTTILMEYGRRHHRAQRARNPSNRTSKGHEHLPVVYLTLGANTSIKGLSAAISDFLNIPYDDRKSEQNLTNLMARVSRACGTGLFLIDDIHFLDCRRREHSEVNKQLKSIASKIPAMFVYAGIDCERTGLLSEDGRPDSSQTGRRFTLQRVRPFETGTASGRQEWAALLAGFEDQLVLLAMPRGTLQGKLAPYLYERSGGVICSLAHLLREGALAAIESGEEKLTQKLLDEIEIDYVAEQERGARRREARQAYRAA